MSGGPNAHALHLLDSMEAGDNFNGWDINTPVFDWYNQSGGGTYTYKWETFLTQELPAWLAASHPRQFIYAGSLSGFLNLSAGEWPGQVRIAMMWNGGFDPDAMWGLPGDPPLASPDAPIAGLGFLEGFAINSNHTFRDAYIAAGGRNAVFNFPDGIHR